MNRRDLIRGGSFAFIAGQLARSSASVFSSESFERGGVDRFRRNIGEASWAKLKNRLNALNHDIVTRGIHPFPGSKEKLETGYAYGTFYDWDLYFENLYLSYYNVSTYDFSNFKMFLDRQKPDGFVSRTLGPLTPRPTQMFKPFLAQLAVLGSKQNNNDVEWLREKYYLCLKKYLERWFQYDPTGSDLPVWNSSDASGMDNQYSRSGDLESYLDQGVDLACYLVHELQCMAWIAIRLGKPTDQKLFLERSRRVAKGINAVFWDETSGFYYDRNAKTGKQIPVKSVAGFIPLWAGVAPPDRARRLIHEHLINPKEFWLKYPVASYARTEPDFYEGTKKGECNWRGCTWIPTNYMIFHGLVDYGFQDIARELAYKTFRMALDENEVTREYYDSNTGKGNGMNPFWGWSSLAYAMPLEYEVHYNPAKIDGPVYPLLHDELGVNFNRPDTTSSAEASLPHSSHTVAV